ncbi:TMEM175 family protein [Arthrobacter sp.]|uniref:TMEM175 family protein n=1 Tax=Arthrobacter sp. TaxID=1667 RepID=UPI0026E10E28|nr:TMEM175 family protein [Arthrobacter sp.]MDO5753238.1 TMEM175 family protein [Arthrobacter sp.]
MDKSRLEALSNGVLAILITIMVLEFKTPQTTDWAGLAAVAYVILQAGFIRQQGHNGPLATAIGRNVKARSTPVIYVAGCALTFISSMFGLAAYAIVAGLWLVPDRGLERALRNGTSEA